MQRPEQSIYLSTTTPPQLATLNLPDTLAYLERIGLPSSTATLPPSLPLLAQLSFAHQTTTSYDSSSLHVTTAEWEEPSTPIVLGDGQGMEMGRGNFERIVLRRGGGHCIALNTLYASLLRGFGFAVAECGARVYLPRGKDAAEVGWLWSALTHVTLVVDWEGSEGRRYVIDVGFGGGGCPYPMLLQDGTTSKSLSPTESFLLKAEKLPGASATQLPGFTFYRRVAPPGQVIADPASADSGPGHWTPCYAFTLSTMCPGDIRMADHFNQFAPDATFTNFFVVSVLLLSGSRKSLIYGRPPAGWSMDGETRRAKLYQKEGIRGEEQNVRMVPFETGPLKEVLSEEFGYRF